MSNELEVRRRAPRGGLNRDRILSAALDLVAREGIQSLTMPAVAAGLNVGTMSLYRHVASKGDLVEGLAERVMLSIPVPPGGEGDWRQCLVRYFSDWRAAAAKYPGLVDAMVRVMPASPSVRVQIEPLYDILTRAGVPARRANRLLSVAFRYAIGSVAWEQAHDGHDSGDFEEGLELILGTVPR